MRSRGVEEEEEYNEEGRDVSLLMGRVCLGRVEIMFCRETKALHDWLVDDWGWSTWVHAHLGPTRAR